MDDFETEEQIARALDELRAKLPVRDVSSLKKGVRFVPVGVSFNFANVHRVTDTYKPATRQSLLAKREFDVVPNIDFRAGTKVYLLNNPAVKELEHLARMLQSILNDKTVHGKPRKQTSDSV